MRAHQRQKVERYGTGPCDKYDASCAERTSTMLQWCEEQFEGQYAEERARCVDAVNHEECEAAALRAFREQVLTCVGD